MSKCIVCAGRERRIAELRAETEKLQSLVDECEALKTEPRQPCPEGFHWVGQEWCHCSECGLPPWEHAGFADFAPGKGPFDPTPMVLKPWYPGAVEAYRRDYNGRCVHQPQRESLSGRGVSGASGTSGVTRA